MTGQRECNEMASVLYAEIYLICMIVVGLLLFWTVRKESVSAMERWLRRVLTAFLLNFAANFLFALCNGLRLIESAWLPLSYLFKTVYHMTLWIGVFAWCGYAEASHKSLLFENKRTHKWLLLCLAVPAMLIVLNLLTHWLFSFDENGTYRRHWLFQAQMALLLGVTTFFAARVVRARRFESDPAVREHTVLIASFPLCILAAWALSFFGESVPVVCVSIMLELLCLYIGTTARQVSLDPLTQVNNRHNLQSFLDYKLKNHENELYLLMIDVDRFKQINDTYGHLEGDAALMRVASALKKACMNILPRPYIARYGGDEFIIVAEGSRAEIDALCDKLRAVLQESAEQAAVPYAVSLSIGVAAYADGMDGKMLIGAADQNLYLHKNGKGR